MEYGQKEAQLMDRIEVPISGPGLRAQSEIRVKSRVRDSGYVSG